MNNSSSKLTKKRISALAGISPGLLSDVLNHGKRVSWSTAKRLAEVTNSSPVDWMESDIEKLKSIIEDIKEAANE